MVHEHTTLTMLRNFFTAVDSLGIPPLQYEIIVAGDWQNTSEAFDSDPPRAPVVYVCGDCKFSDKIRAIFEVAVHEFVWVSHDYVIPLPSFYNAMRSFGRSAPWFVPGIFHDLNGQEMDEMVVRGRLLTSRSPERSLYISTSSEEDIVPISVHSEKIPFEHYDSGFETHYYKGSCEHHELLEMAWQDPTATAVLRSIIDQGHVDRQSNDNRYDDDDDTCDGGCDGNYDDDGADADDVADDPEDAEDNTSNR